MFAICKILFIEEKIDSDELACMKKLMHKSLLQQSVVILRLEF